MEVVEELATWPVVAFAVGMALLPVVALAAVAILSLVADQWREGDDGEGPPPWRRR